MNVDNHSGAKNTTLRFLTPPTVWAHFLLEGRSVSVFVFKFILRKELRL